MKDGTAEKTVEGGSGSSESVAKAHASVQPGTPSGVDKTTSSTPNKSVSGLGPSHGASTVTTYKGPRGFVRYSTGPWDHHVVIIGETGKLISSVSYKRGTAMGDTCAEARARADLKAAVNSIKAGASHRLEPESPHFWGY